MQTTTYITADQALLALLQDAAPNGQDYANVVQQYNDMLQHVGLGNRGQVTKWLLTLCLDGMAYGNWPWVWNHTTASSS